MAVNGSCWWSMRMQTLGIVSCAKLFVTLRSVSVAPYAVLPVATLTEQNTGQKN